MLASRERERPEFAPLRSLTLPARQHPETAGLASPELSGYRASSPFPGAVEAPTMKRSVFLVCQPLILLAAFRTSHSATGFLLLGVGPVLLLDKYLSRLLPWDRFSWRRELCVRAGYIVGGAVVLTLSRRGIVPLREAVLLGVGLSLAAFLLESFVELTGRRPWSRFAVLGLLLFLAPLVAVHRFHTVPKRDPSSWGLAFEDVRFGTADGVTLGGWLVPHPQARGNVLFCHGHGRNRGHVSGLLPTLHALRLNVLTFDFRGHGDSPGHTLTFGHREIHDLLGAAAFLRRRFPGQPLLIVGVSYGAAVTLQTLPRLPDVAGVWSEGSFARLENIAANELKPVPAWLRGGLVSACDALALLDCGFHIRDVNPVESLTGVAVPICFCHAREDRLIPLAEGEALCAAYTGPKRKWWVEGATHYNIRQRNREEYLRRLRSFFEECLSAVRHDHERSTPPPAQVHGPAASYAKPRFAEVVEGIRVGAASLFQGIGQHGEASRFQFARRQGPLRVDSLDQLPHGGREPRQLEGNGVERVADNAAE